MATRIIKTILPSEEHGRHSEGDFIRLKDGRILFVYTRYIGDMAKDSSPAGLASMYSSDDGETWTEPEELFHPSQFNTTNIMSVTLLRLLNGDLGLVFSVRPTQGWCSRHVLLRSADEGKTFYAENDIDVPEYGGRFGLNNSRIERLSSGRLIVPYSIHPGIYKEDKDGIKARVSRYTQGHIIYSDDDGYTWRSSTDVICPTFTDTSKGLQEGGVIEIAPGILRSYWRSDVGHQYMSISFDNGDHWTLPQRSRFTAPWSPMKMIKNPFNGKLYAVWNPIPLYNGREFHNYNWGRSPFVYAEVSPDGNIPGEIRVIEDEPTHGYCYPAILFTKENEMLMAYCCGGKETNTSCLAALRISKITIE